MPGPWSWYFDYISPYAYFQWRSMGELPRDLEVSLEPVLFAGLLDHWGTKGPAEVAAKRVFTYRFAQWYAGHHGIALRMPPAHPFNPLPALRLTVALDSTPEVVDRIFNFIWGEGRTFDDPEAVEALAASLGVDEPAALMARQDVKDRLRENTEGALARGVFGVPTFHDGEMLVWGHDAMGMLLEYLTDPERFRSGEMKRVAELPAAIHRKAISA